MAAGRLTHFEMRMGPGPDRLRHSHLETGNAMPPAPFPYRARLFFERSPRARSIWPALVESSTSSRSDGCRCSWGRVAPTSADFSVFQFRCQIDVASSGTPHRSGRADLLQPNAPCRKLRSCRDFGRQCDVLDSGHGFLYLGACWTCAQHAPIRLFWTRPSRVASIMACRLRRCCGGPQLGANRPRELVCAPLERR